MNNNNLLCTISLFLGLLISCENAPTKKFHKKNYSNNILNYKGTPYFSKDKRMLMFSDQGAWFAYSFPDTVLSLNGFSGPFLMTEQNGVWSSVSLATLQLFDANGNRIVWDNQQTNSFNSHLEQTFDNGDLNLKQELVYSSGHTTLVKSSITNNSSQPINVSYSWKSQPLLTEGLEFSLDKNEVIVKSNNTSAVGYFLFANETVILTNDSSYVSATESISLSSGQSKEILISQTFIFPEYSWDNERKSIENIDFDSVLSIRKKEKENQLASLIKNKKSNFSDEKYTEVLAKSQLTLQNNWRIAAGELKHEGLFPSYHYKWFNGFWSWDSWKHAVGLSYFNINLAKNQMRAMFDFQTENGFIVDCVYRDTTIETHNYRDTKPPLAAWAVLRIFEKDNDIDFVKEFYPKLRKYHNWWYANRDHDRDGICEYGSTDGSLVAAKWESGMDNAIRFDNSKILKNSEGAYSLDQESVDLNAYLYAEKLFLAKLAEAISLLEEVQTYHADATLLKTQIQNQFFDNNDGWFYDTNIEGDTFIKGEGSEGWTTLWANAATQEQAEAVKHKMMNPQKFFTKVPFQTMSADHSKFDPMRGYWRGPNWLDQAYFGVKGLRNYGFNEEADQATMKIIEGAEGVLGKGKAIRENYHPITGEGLNAENFSWSAAHIIMLLMDDK